jgi:predicted NBD/HSP70 family sugar kinase
MRKPAAIGIDVGGTKTLCMLVDRHFRRFEQAKFKSATEGGRIRFTSQGILPQSNEQQPDLFENPANG